MFEKTRSLLVLPPSAVNAADQDALFKLSPSSIRALDRSNIPPPSFLRTPFLAHLFAENPNYFEVS